MGVELKDFKIYRKGEKIFDLLEIISFKNSFVKNLSNENLKIIG